MCCCAGLLVAAVAAADDGDARAERTSPSCWSDARGMGAASGTGASGTEPPQCVGSVTVFVGFEFLFFREFPLAMFELRDGTGDDVLLAGLVHLAREDASSWCREFEPTEVTELDFFNWLELVDFLLPEVASEGESFGSLSSAAWEPLEGRPESRSTLNPDDRRSWTLLDFSDESLGSCLTRLKGVVLGTWSRKGGRPGGLMLYRPGWWAEAADMEAR